MNSQPSCKVNLSESLIPLVAQVFEIPVYYLRQSPPIFLDKMMAGRYIPDIPVWRGREIWLFGFLYLPP